MRLGPQRGFLRKVPRFLMHMAHDGIDLTLIVQVQNVPNLGPESANIRPLPEPA